DKAAIAACSQLAPLLPTLSGERVAAEMLRLLMAPDPASAMALMRDHGVLQHILPELTEIERLRMLVLIEDETEQRDAIRRLASVLPGETATALTVAERLRLSNADRDRLAALASPANVVAPPLDELARRRALHRLGADLFRDLVLLDWAEQPAAAKRHRELL